MLPKILDKHHIAWAKAYVVLFYLLKTITKVIIKATAMIVTVTNPKNSNHIN